MRFQSAEAAAVGPPLLLLLVTTALCGDARAISSDPACLLPCQGLSHGCLCNHSQPSFDPSDYQFYGTCTSCNPYWSGWNCQRRAVPCLNGGAVAADGTTCLCPLDWAGATCEHRLCAAGGGKFVAPNQTTNSCDEACAPGFSGLQCEACPRGGDAAPLCSGPDGGRCLSTHVAPAADALSYRLDCDVASQQLNFALANGRPGVMGKIDFVCGQKPTPWGSGAHDGNCTGNLYRQEPNGAYTDRYFTCEFWNCDSASARENATTMTTFRCLTSRCECAPAPQNPEYYPSCNTSMAAMFLKQVTGWSKISCGSNTTAATGATEGSHDDNTTTDCVLEGEQLPIEFPLACNVTSCVPS